PLLIDHFVKKFRAEKQKDIAGVSDEVIAMLMKYDYPGNIRELENIIEYGFILCPGGLIQQEHLPDTFEARMDLTATPLSSSYEGLSLEEIEKQAILLSLERNQWRKMLTCRELGVSKDTLRRKIERYNLVNPLE
ncbi:MAG: helix-turn-helix domain-containing protein, partial [Desulforhopalus sp.]|nr:helix-turn-helix domain-containing protein [Desulforhopalus sp.]